MLAALVDHDHEYCSVRRNGRILEVTLRRPEVLNALYAPAHQELSRIWDLFAADPDLWVAILTGTGDRAFCAGNDLKATAAGEPKPYVPTGFGGLTGRFDLDKPLIAAVNGFAMGGGFELALACDLIVASENAVFGLPEPKVGLAALSGGIHRLVRQLPTKVAMGILLTGRHVTASEALSIGLINEVVPQGEAVIGARRWAEQILACSPASIRTTKHCAQRGQGESSLQSAFHAQYPAVMALLAGNDAREGPKAFAEKRRPHWGDG